MFIQYDLSLAAVGELGGAAVLWISGAVQR